MEFIIGKRASGKSTHAASLMKDKPFIVITNNEKDASYYKQTCNNAEMQKYRNTEYRIHKNT
jgi:predicted kinase